MPSRHWVHKQLASAATTLSMALARAPTAMGCLCSILSATPEMGPVVHAIFLQLAAMYEAAVPAMNPCPLQPPSHNCRLTTKIETPAGQQSLQKPTKLLPQALTRFDIHTCQGSKLHSLVPDLLFGRLMGSLAEYMRPRLLLLPLLLLPSPLLLLAGDPLRHLLPMAPSLLLLLLACCNSSVSMSSSVSMAARGLPLLLEVPLLPALLLVLEVGLAFQLPCWLSKSSRVLMNQGGSLALSLFSLRQAVSFNSRTALLTSSCLRCCCGRFGGKFCTRLACLEDPLLLADAGGAGCCGAAAWPLLLMLLLLSVPVRVLALGSALLPGLLVPSGPNWASLTCSPSHWWSGNALHARGPLCLRAGGFCRYCTAGERAGSTPARFMSCRRAREFDYQLDVGYSWMNRAQRTGPRSSVDSMRRSRLGSSSLHA